TGSQEVPASVRLLDSDELLPGQQGWAQLRLSRPAIMARRDRFIVRIPSPSMTIGGGEVVDVHPRYHKRRQAAVLRDLETLEHGSPEELVLAALDRRRENSAKKAPAEAERATSKNAGHRAKVTPGLTGYELAEVAARSNLSLDVTQQTLETLLVEGRARKLGTNWFAQAVWDTIQEETQRLLSEQHRQYPLRSGLSKEEWRVRLGLSPRMATEVLAGLQEEGQVAEALGVSGGAGGYIRLPDFQPTFTPAQQRSVEQLLRQFRDHPFAPPGRAEVEAQVGSEVLLALIEQGILVRVGNAADTALFLRESYDEAVRKLLAYLREHGTMTAAEARDVLGTTRKYILPLLEHLDERRITRRTGDERVLGPAAPEPYISS
ncbi:MAG TPA: SelB C-terminal domain-containing protein, partial [Ktedonobacteraceae bacterium]|nr:SelB C-terminal domain-containing protein [Ktedonobacteraceae bacterium]